MHILLYASILLFACNIADGKRVQKLQCKDESNKPVDWYVLYKLPKVPQSSNPLIRQGLAYLYITNKSLDIGWQLSTRSIGANNSIPGNTLAPIYDDDNVNSTLWVLYNDSPPETNYSGKYGHTKGTVMTNKKQGLWLIHSVPNFPPFPKGGEHLRKRVEEQNSTRNIAAERYDYPLSGQIYGQSFLCISLDSSQLDIVGKQLMYNQIIVYNRNIPGNLGKQYPTLNDAAKQVRIRQAPFNHKAVLTSAQSLEFISFAKSDKWQKDLYDDFVAPQLQSDLLVQTWLNGRGRLPSDCVGAKVYNIESLRLDAAHLTFASSRDHSKWAVAAQNKTDRSWVCVGDINRADTQYYRGGGAVCFKLFDVWKNYHNAVNDVEPCPRKI